MRSKTRSHYQALVCLALLMFLTGPLCSGQSIQGSLAGTVTDNSGAVLARVQVSLVNRDTGKRLVTRTNGEGAYFFSHIPVGVYDLEVSVPGFAALRVQGINVGAGQSARMDVVLGQGATRPPPPPPRPPPPPPPPPPPAHRTFADPVWNVWTEVFSTTPSYRPVTPQSGHDYSLVVNLSALLYSQFAGEAVYSQGASSAFSNWVDQNKDLDSADVDVLVLPDRRYFTSQPNSERTKSLHIDLAKIRTAKKDGFDLANDPLDFLREHGGTAPFSFGMQFFRIRTTSQAGNGAIALSIWVNGKPIDELSVSLCIVAHANDACNPTPATTQTLRGVDLSGKAPFPNAALHLIDRQSDIVGVYRCNTCGWAKDDYRTWQIEESSQWFADRTKEILDLVTQPPDPQSKVTTLQMFEHAGDNMFNVVFDSQGADVVTAKKAFGELVSSGRVADGQKKNAPSLFVRIIPGKPELVLAPVSLIRAVLADGSKEFVGSYVDIQSPLEFQDYSTPPVCISKWELFVPPDKTLSSLREVLKARGEFTDWIDTFRRLCRDCVTNDENDFQTWLGNTQASESEGVVILSHHNANSLWFYDGGSPAIQSTSISRSFGSPSLAIIDGCGTSEPGASEFIRQFNSHGVTSVIATTTEVEPTMAGRFLTIFMDSLASHNNDNSYTVSKARFDAVKSLRTVKDDNGEVYGPRALVFMFAGNGALRACVPAKVQTGTK